MQQRPFGHLGRKASVVAFAVACVCLQAGATNIGINPRTAPSVVNPFNGQATTVWKFVGKASGCTAVLITPQWVLSSAHCPAGAASGYTNEYIAPGVTDPLMFGQTVNLPQASNWPVCATVTVPSPLNPAQQMATDFFVCRLVNPAPFANAGPFPPLVAGPVRGVASPHFPTPQQLATGTAGLGSLMLYGRAGPDLLTFQGFNGVPFGYSAISDPTGSTIAELVGGDSGGAVYSFSPITGQPALTGMTVSPMQYLTEEAIQFIQTHIQQYGDTPPASVSVASHYGDVTALSAADLATPPTALVVSPGVVKVRWTAPNDSSITSYAVSHGLAGSSPARLTAGASSREVTINTGSATQWSACVQPVNPRGPGNAAWVVSRYPGAKQFKTPNCSTFDLRVPGQPIMSVSTRYESALRMHRVTATWQTTGDVPIASHKVSSSLTYPTGPVRTTTSSVSGNSHSVLAPAGSTVCLSVASVTSVGATSIAAPQQCRKVQ